MFFLFASFQTNISSTSAGGGHKRVRALHIIANDFRANNPSGSRFSERENHRVRAWRNKLDAIRATLLNRMNYYRSIYVKRTFDRLNALTIFIPLPRPLVYENLIIKQLRFTKIVSIRQVYIRT